MRNYRQEVHRIIEHFEAFDITTIPKTKNFIVDSLTTTASRLSPIEDYEDSWFIVELLYKLSMPNNISNWKVFEGDDQIINILTNQDNFKYMAIGDEVFQEQSAETDPQIDQLTEKPRSHKIPKGIYNLENLFDLRERFKGSKNAKTGISCPMYETINLGTPKNPKTINLGKTVSKEERKAYLKLFKQYKEVFPWSYEDMKTYDTRIIQHTISLKPEVKPFQ
jgi:hypothetical protein